MVSLISIKTRLLCATK